MGGDDETKGKNHAFVYIASKDYAWIPATLLDTDKGKAHVEVPHYKDEQSIVCDGGASASKKTKEWVDLKKYPNKVLPLQNVTGGGQLIEYPDMVDIPFLHEAGILFNLKLRHLRGRPYTRTGDIIIAINPFQWFTELYTEKKQIMYSNRLVWESTHTEQDPRRGLEPHVYEASALVYRGLAFDREDQSILVSGESGAGKTETVKICMNHIASVQKGRDIKSGGEIDPVVRRVLNSNPLLEAFGNAKTTRNDNSSRFGKYTQLQFHRPEDEMAGSIDLANTICKLAGSKCEAYLLEKNRVTGHEDVERTYHIFYQILAAPDAEKTKLWDGLKGTDFNSYKYVGDTDTKKIEGMTDAQHFEKTRETLELIHLGGDKYTMLMRAILVVMQTGNLTFGPREGDSDKSDCTSKKELKGLAELMGVPEDALNKAFTERTMKTRGETYKVPQDAKTAKESADAFAKEVYGKLFLWLVSGINEATKAEKNFEGGGLASSDFGIIGLLDIFGFESFLINRFEQLCINYANEKLQQKFTEDIFRSVQAEYIEEGIALAEITYDDNTDVLDLIEGRTGLCALLNEECVRPKGSDEAFVNKALAQNKKSPCIVVNHMDRMSFGIHHYAGKVMYSAEFFVVRNQDTLPTDVEELMQISTNEIVSHVAVDNEPAKAKPGRQKSNIVGKTIWTKYKTQLATLMTDLRKTTSRYIRCIKPNKPKKPSVMEHVGTVEQLRCAGVVAAVTITRSAFPNRLDHAPAYRRFLPLKPAAAGKADKNDIKALLAELMDSALASLVQGEGENTKKAYVIGKTKIYFRAGAMEYLESERLKGCDKWAVIMQRVYRGYCVRKKLGGINGYKMQAKAPKAITIQCWYRQLAAKFKLGRLRKKHKEKKKKAKKRVRAAMKIQACGRGYLVRPKFKKKLKLMKERERLKKLANDLEEKVREAEMKRLQNVEAAREAAENEIEEYKEVVREELKSDKEKQKKYAQQQTLIDESSNIIEFLRRENTKLKNQSEGMRKDFKELKDNNKRLQEENEAATSSFTALNDHAKQLNVKNAKLITNVQEYKKKLEGLKDDLKEKQSYYIAEAEARLAAQKRMAAIVGTIQDKCRDPQLIEDAVIMALECEAEAKAERAALDAQDGKSAPATGTTAAVADDDSTDYGDISSDEDSDDDSD
ncbi:Unconventional myosin [Seminavis robusta]|uniref:Unconventional myosin n=1 Tax=Seminavis robusta TaxID=568900 RepID=A0A9N8H1N8_9STRA|nr:Unconventional myosin [Seminavis robusta]|eukprot:Sro20_g014190.1 Unconventional myosin (1164) ;mRNA; f:102518-106110